MDMQQNFVLDLSQKTQRSQLESLLRPAHSGRPSTTKYEAFPPALELRPDQPRGFQPIPPKLELRPNQAKGFEPISPTAVQLNPAHQQMLRTTALHTNTIKFEEKPPASAKSVSPPAHISPGLTEEARHPCFQGYQMVPQNYFASLVPEETPAPVKPPKVTRPFKAITKEPFTMASDLETNPSFIEFRERCLMQVRGNGTGTNKNMRRTSQNASNRTDDPTYWEKRRKNNEAAKRSRDARRAKEDELAIRCAFLESENIKLKFQVTSLEAERIRLQNMVLQKSQ